MTGGDTYQQNFEEPPYCPYCDTAIPEHVVTRESRQVKKKCPHCGKHYLRTALIAFATYKIEKRCTVCGEIEGKSPFCRQCCDECDTNEHTYEGDD